MFYLIGITCGLAIYNHTIINLPFPLVLYKKLLGAKKKLGLEDLAQLSPSTAKGLKDLLEYDGDDLEDVFCLDFTATVSAFGESETRPLKKDGHKIAVTKQNKCEYVDLYCDFILNESVKDKFRAFEKGFSDVCLGPVMELFHPHELMALVVGNENYDWNELEAHAEYKSGYSADHPTIQHFWSVFHKDLTLEDKKRFLLFLTGCDRIPIQGMKAVPIIIQKVNNDSLLPVAHTCFNLLDLPSYATREKLKYKLLKAIQHAEGFGLA